MILSVIIPSRNRGSNLKGTLEALATQSMDKAEYEVILVDDNSNDDTISLVNQFKDRMRLKYIFTNVPKPHTWNASVIRNIGANVADKSTIAYLFVDSDVILPPTALVSYAEDLAINNERVIIGPYDFYKEGNTEIAQKDVRSKKFEEVNKSEVFNTVFDGLSCFGGNIVMPKKIFWSVGGFDEDVHIGLEDGSMGLKLWKIKVGFSYEARTRGKHQWHATPTDRFPSDMREHIDHLNMKHFGTKNPDYGIIEASRDTYEKLGFPDWEPPESWQMRKMGFMLTVNKEDTK